MRKKNKLIFGVGSNDADYEVYVYSVTGGASKVVWICPFYKAWKSVFVRCYSEKFQAKRSTYSGCSVTKEWHLFSAFRAWMLTQPWRGNHLDKDILQPGNKIYSPDTCAFVSGQLNAFMTDSGAARGEWPIGVSWHKRDEVFTANCNNPFTGRQESLGYFRCPAEAHEAWRRRKHEHALRYADMQTDPRIAAALRGRYANHG